MNRSEQRSIDERAYEFVPPEECDERAFLATIAAAAEAGLAQPQHAKSMLEDVRDMVALRLKRIETPTAR